MSSVVIRGGLEAGDVRPYKERNLSYSPAKGSGELAEHSDGPDGPDHFYEPWEISELGPLLFLIAAQETAERIVTEAHAQAEQIQQQAIERAIADASEEAKKELLASLTAFANAAQALIVFEEQFVSRYTPELVRLALQIAEKLIGKAVGEDQEIIASVLDRARREITEARDIRIRLHPADLRVLSQLRPDLINVGEAAGRRVEVLACDEIQRGGCRVETDIGVVDATIPTQLQEIRRQLLDEDSPRPNGPHIVPVGKDE